MTYKLIRKFYESPEIGFKVTWSPVLKMYVNGRENVYSKESIEFSPLFWEKVEEEGYKVNAYKYNGYVYTDNGKMYKCEGIGEIWYESVNNWNLQPLIIYSVKRLSDGEIFTIGDLIQGKGLLTFKIEEFVYVGGVLKIIAQATYSKTTSLSIPINDAKKAKKFVLKTEDGGEVYEANVYWYVNFPDSPNVRWSPLPCIADSSLKDLSPLGWKQFSTEAAARKFIEENQPKYSLQDIREVMGNRDFIGTQFLIEELRHGNKNKI